MIHSNQILLNKTRCDVDRFSGLFLRSFEFLFTLLLLYLT